MQPARACARSLPFRRRPSWPARPWPLPCPDVPLVAWALALAGAVGVLIAAWQTANAALLLAALWASFCGGGSLLAADAWQRAWRPPLRLAFEAIVAYDRSDAEARSRRTSARPRTPTPARG